MALPRLRGYAVVRPLGSGQFGDVYLVRRERDGRLFAAKVARGGPAVSTEAQLLQHLRHPNVVACEEVVPSDGGAAIVMEYAVGGDLEGLLRGYAQRQEHMPEDEVMRVFIQLALALGYLHEQRVLHRDLKPQNVLLDGDRVVKISDFGVSRSLQRTLDAAQTIAGTPSYMSPELMDNRPYDTKTDVWSLGCILYELVTLSPPFQAKALGALVLQIVNQEPPPLPTSYSSQLNELVRLLLSKDPSDRPTISDMLMMPFVQRHVYRIASSAPGRSAAVVPLLRADVSSDKEYLQMGAPLSDPARIDLKATNSDSKTQSDPQLRCITPNGTKEAMDAARRVFLENQAAARRNKDRVAREKTAPAPFLDLDCATTEPPRQLEGRNARAESDEVAQRAVDLVRQVYAENARVAKLNKQRAIEDMRGPEDGILPSFPHTDESLSDGKHTPSTMPPPAPDRQVGRDYEALLEAERRRVRVERKALQERMRSLQMVPSSSNAETYTEGTL